MPADTQAGRPRIDLSRYELTLDGRRVKLERQPMELLIFFLERKGQLVSRKDIIGKLWGPHVFVDVDRSINAAVRKIRSALKDDPDQPKYLETVVGKGYRLVGEMELVSELPKAPEKSPETQIHSLAVLPLVNLSGDSSQDYFSEGITDALITELAQLSSLRVISRTSAMHYKNSHQPLPEIARELNVDAVVEGSVIRSGNRVRITAQLLEARSDRHLWAKAYDRDIREIISLQQDVADSIVNEIQAKLTAKENPRLSRKQQVDPEAYDDYLRGLYFWHKFTEAGTRRAVEYFEESVHKDPSYALAYAGLAIAYNRLALYVTARDAIQRSKEASQKALQLDDTLADAHASLGYVRWIFDWDWSGAESEFQRAIQLNPGHAICHGMYAHYLDCMGRFEDAVREHQIARELDPLALNLINDAAAHFLVLRQYDKAIEENRMLLDMDSNFVEAHADLAIAYKCKGMEEESISELEQAAMLDGEPNLAEAMKIAYVRGGYKGALRARLKYNQHRRSAGTHIDFWDDARTLAQLGNKDLALQALEKAFAERENIVWLNVDPEWDPLRDDPRFQELVRRIGFP